MQDMVMRFLRREVIYPDELWARDLILSRSFGGDLGTVQPSGRTPQQLPLQHGNGER